MNSDEAFSRAKSLPRHVAMILDGNRRWARDRKLPSYMGHYHGLWTNVIGITDHCIVRTIDNLSLFGFSTENWSRDDEEINFLMDLFEQFAIRETANWHRKGVRLRILGDIESLPSSLQGCLQRAVALTAGNSTLGLNLAINYGGRSEIVRATNRILRAVPSIIEVSETLLNSSLDTQMLPDPDLIIRTGGEQRLSNFMLWQAAYSELYFTDKYWPDFDEGDLDTAIDEFQRRQRRWGA